MTKDDIISMAREAGLIRDDSTAARLLPGTDLYPELNVFASLVAEHARNRTWTQAHWTEYERSIAAAEREACIDIVARHGGSVEIEAAIRARGQDAS